MLCAFQRHIHEYNTTGVQGTTTRKWPIIMCWSWRI
jgi:hypothetical protein